MAFLEFATEKPHVDTTTPGKLAVGTSWNPWNFMFVQDNSTALSFTRDGGVLKERGTHAVVSERVVLVPTAAVLLLLIIVAMIAGVMAAV